ncbi:hypothetical protein [Rhodopseudomonas pseudopalustris]|uniref:hypothetical protein n=1 Tax=Rhodopseudomonas pseudopalustris TaxID=1513892 RepID=UPI000B842334|nr:hypothetical protein [Rhodopseudomonas pseudopalustris]
MAIGPRPVRASVDASIGSSNLVLKPSINVAAGIPGNFAAETVAVRGGTLHAVITAVPGERYLLLSDRACGRGACGRSPTLILTFQPSRTVAVDVGVVVPNVTVRPKTGEMARRAATVRGSAAVVPSPEVIAIAAGRFPVRPRVALFTFD